MIIGRILEAISMLSVMMTIINPISYKVEQLKIHDRPQTIYTLSINTDNPNVELKNILSYNVLFGVDKTSNMVMESGALFGVNGMFYDEFGAPYGILIIDGKVVTMDSINTPTMVVTETGQVSLEKIDIKGSVKGIKNTIQLEGTNKGVSDGKWVLFHDVYGDTTRVSRYSMNYIIKDNIVTEIIYTDMPVAIEKQDYVLTQVTNETIPVFEKGETLDIQFQISNHENKDIAQAFQTGGWLVYEGENIAKNYEPFIGYTTGLNPRTLIGITEEQQLIVKVIDGRIPKISLGITGYEAAELMKEEGCIYAAYLDGGASSTMVIGGKVVNKPSNGEERKVAHALIIGIKNVGKILAQDLKRIGN
jgi:exopolysaccharide biosynthesis protein